MAIAARRTPLPDRVLLRRFGLVRVVGAAAYFLAALVLLVVLGAQTWPLLAGVPILAIVTVWYFLRSDRAPRTAVTVSLIADALVLGGVVAFLGGTGSGLVGLYAIVIVSGGILLGPSAAWQFFALSLLLALLQLLFEQLGLQPPVLWRPDLGDRLPVLLVSLAGIGSVAYLTASYASRLHQLIEQAAARAEEVRRLRRRRADLVREASAAIDEPLRMLRDVAAQLGSGDEPLGSQDRQRLARRLRRSAARLEADVGQIADVGALDHVSDVRPQPLLLRSVVDEALQSVADQLAGHAVTVDLPPLRVLGDPRVARRVVVNLLENVAEHTPEGTSASVTARSTGGHGVLVVADDGPGVPAHLVPTLFASPSPGSGRVAVGLPLVRELCEAMGATIRYMPPPSGGARFLVAFRLAPRSAPDPSESPPDALAAVADAADAGRRRTSAS